MNSGSRLTDKIYRFAAFMAKPDILFYTLPWLMILITLGTISQKNMGLYAATEKYINAVIWWLGPIPLPGGLSIIGIIFLALFIKFIFFSKWSWNQSGIILTHLGVLLLLLGGMMTAGLSREGFMLISEGQTVNSISDYRQRVFIIKSSEGARHTFKFDELKEGQEIKQDNLHLKILSMCQNCSAQAPSGKYDNLQELAVNMELVNIPSGKNPEANFSGLTFAIEQATDKNNIGTYIVMEDIPKIPTIVGYEISLEREKEELPFAILLQDFRKIDYAGTTKAKEFESDIVVQDGNVSWPVTISMNKPLRYKGYSFYQSSFEQRPDIEVTVLSVVKNAGWIFPYISTLVIFGGLLLHLIIRVQTQRPIS